MGEEPATSDRDPILLATLAGSVVALAWMLASAPEPSRYVTLGMSASDWASVIGPSFWCVASLLGLTLAIHLQRGVREQTPALLWALAAAATLGLADLWLLYHRSATGVVAAAPLTSMLCVVVTAALLRRDPEVHALLRGERSLGGPYPPQLSVPLLLGLGALGLTIHAWSLAALSLTGVPEIGW